MSIPARFLLLASIVLVGWHVWGALHPVHANWGVHMFGFHGTTWGIFSLLIVAVMAFPKIQNAVLDRVEKLTRFFAARPMIVGIIGSIAAIAGAAYFFSPRLHLLGDGAILIRSIPRAQWGAELISSFRNQPIVEVVYRWIMNFSPPSTPPRDIYVTIDLLAAAMFMTLTFWMARNIQRPPLERFLLGMMLFFTAGSQFFLGYVENYVLQYVVTTAYIVSGWLCLERRSPVIFPIALFAILPGFGLGSLILAPSFLFLLLWQFRERKLIALAVIAGCFVLGLIGLSFVGFSIIGFIEHLTRGGVDFLQPFSATGGNFPYPIFSLTHLLDWLNANALIVPFGLAAVVILSPTIPRAQWRTNPSLPFLAIATLCGLLFTIIINPALGMARDWDMLSSFFIPLSIFSIYLFAQPFASNEWRRYVLTLVVLIMGCHWAGWIGVNADEQKHLNRVKALGDPTIISRAAQMAHDEALANFFFNNANYAEARIYYERYMEIDAINPRILGNISDLYRKLGEKELYFQTLLRAVNLNNPNPGIYSNLGVEFASRKDTARAIEFNERALALDPNQPKAHANLGILYMAKKNFEKADEHFSAAINLGMRDPMLFRYAGDAAVVRNDLQRALRYYDACLELSPDDARIRKVRDNIREAAGRAIKK